MQSQRQFIPTILTFLYQFTAGFTWVYQHILRPIGLTLFWRPMRWLARVYYWKIWQNFVYLKTGHFSRKRAGVVIATTAAVLYFVVPVMFLLLYQTTLFALTYEHKEIILSNTEEINPDENIHNVIGPDVYFRVQSSLFHQIWSLLYQGEFFYPDDVVSYIAPGQNRCDTISYGYRAKWFRVRDIYPDMLMANCVYLGGAVPSQQPTD